MRLILQIRRASTQVTRRRVVITGSGAVTPLANNVAESWQRLLAGESAISQLGSDFKGLPCQVAAQIPRERLQIDKHLSKSDLKLMSPATQFAIIAADEALAAAKLQPSELTADQRERFGVCVGMGMFDLSEVYGAYQQLQRGYNRVSPYFVPRLLPNMACGHISMRHGLRGPNHSVSTACATGAHAIGDALRFIRYGDADVMLAGSGEACIDPLSIAGFCRLRALSTAFNDNPAAASRPFDKARDGFVMGEGAAVLLLEELEHARARGAPILAELLGYGLSGDAHHITSPSDDGAGATLAMRRAIADAAHAIRRVFGEHKSNVFVSSTKGAHGHLLGSSGNLEALFVVHACAENKLPPSINIENLDVDVNVVTRTCKWSEDQNRRIALKNSFGFGGTNASLCIASYTED
ncbi:hypothetical protein ACLKA6_009268 [Drosophila palustris]